MDPLLISLVSAATALVASIVGPVVSLIVSKRQFNANVLSANRQKWIESLRDLLAELISQIVAALVMKKASKEKWSDGFDAAAADPALLHRIERIVLIQWKIRLLTNPSEPDHQELCRAIEATLIHLKSGAVEETETRASVEHITHVSHAILKREWERVKKGV